MKNLNQAIRHALTEPAPSIKDPADRREARLLATLLILLTVASVVAEALIVLLRMQRDPRAPLDISYVMPALATLLIAYGLSRTRHYRLGAQVITVASVALCFLIAIYGNTPPSLDFLVYSFIPVLLASIFISAAGVLTVMGLTIAGMVLLPVLHPAISLLEVAAGPLMYYVIACAVYLFARYQRAYLDHLRRRQLLEAERRYQALFDHANDGIAILNFDGTFRDANRRLATMLGYPLGDLVQTSIYALLPPEEREASKQILNLLRRGQTPPIYERTLLAKDGRQVPVEMNVTLVRDDNGDPRYIQSVMRDITQRKSSRQILQRRHRDLMVLNRIISAATSTLEDARMLQVLCGELAYAFDLPHVYSARIYEGDEEAPVIAEYAHPGAHILKGDAIPLEAPAIKHVMEHRATLQIRQPQSDMRMVGWAQFIPEDEMTSILLVPLQTREHTVSIVGMEIPNPEALKIEDLELIHNAAAAVAQAIETATLYRQQQQRAEGLRKLVDQRTAELQEALGRAQTADRSKSQFVSNVSHELRTPLASIRLYLDLANRGNPERIKTYLSALTRETLRLQNLVESLLLISRLDLGKIQLTLREIDLNRIVTTLVSDRRTLLSDRDLHLTSEVDPAMPRVQADARLIEQVVTNLLTNAMNYTPEGGNVWLTTRLQQTGGQDWATIIVKDTGLGIPAEELAQLFRRFERGSASATLQIPGTGLGLAICKEIIDLHKGRITVDSTVGQGSTFTVWLPLVQDRNEAQQPPDILTV
jgi:PAS domain S-box-containing protein